MTAWSHALVTGGAGFIGSHLTRALLADGRRVTVLDNLSVGRREAVPEGARFVHGDLRDDARGRRRAQRRRLRVSSRRAGHHPRQLRSILRRSRHQRDGHGAAAAGGRSAPRSSGSCSRRRWRSTPTPTRRTPIDEAASNAAAVAVRRRQARRRRRLASDSGRARHSVHRGALLQHLRPRTDLHAVCRRASRSSSTRLLRGESTIVFGDGEQQRDFVHVEDIVAGTMAAPGREPGTYNLGTGRGTSLNELAALLTRRINPSLAPQHAPAPPARCATRLPTSARRAARSDIHPPARLPKTSSRSSTISAGAAGEPETPTLPTGPHPSLAPDRQDLRVFQYLWKIDH